MKWEIPPEWSWMLDDPKTRTRCRRLLDEADIRSMIAPFCPRVAAGEIPACEHVEQAVDLWNDNWGLAVFITNDATAGDPVDIPEHTHEVDERLFVVNGQGLFALNDHVTQFYSQRVIDVQAGDVHSALLYHPTRVISAFRTVNGERSYMG